MPLSDPIHLLQHLCARMYPLVLLGPSCKSLQACGQKWAGVGRGRESDDDHEVVAVVAVVIVVVVVKTIFSVI